MGELILKGPLFPGKDKADQLNKIFEIVGTPGIQTLNEICDPGL